MGGGAIAVRQSLCYDVVVPRRHDGTALRASENPDAREETE